VTYRARGGSRRPPPPAATSENNLGAINAPQRFLSTYTYVDNLLSRFRIHSIAPREMKSLSRRIKRSACAWSRRKRSYVEADYLFTRKRSRG